MDDESMQREPETSEGSAPPKTFSIWEQVGGVMRKLGDVPLFLLATVRQQILEFSKPVHGNSEPVRVLAIDVDELRKWQPPRGNAGVIEVEQLFPSALAASLALGFPRNEVGIQLAKARKRKEQMSERSTLLPLRASVVLHGVTLQYERDVV